MASPIMPMPESAKSISLGHASERLSSTPRQACSLEEHSLEEHTANIARVDHERDLTNAADWWVLLINGVTA